MNILAYGDQALVLLFSNRIAPEFHHQVMGYVHQLKKASIPGIISMIPAYSSLTICYDPNVTSFNALSDQLELLNGDVSERYEPQSWNIPVCYDPEFAPDMDIVADHTGLSVESIVKEHTQTQYLVYMLGFLPGFSYLGLLPESLKVPRRRSPRLRVPPGSVGIAQQQTGIYPCEAPGGWQLIGKTPIPLFNTFTQGFLLGAGDQVRFTAISISEYSEWLSRAEKSDFNPGVLHD